MSMHQHSDRPSLAANGPHSQHDLNSGEPSFWRSKTDIVAVGFFLIAAFLLLSEHRAHAFGYLPFLFLLACPFLHMFMHKGHGGHGGRHGPGDSARRSDRPNPPSEGA